MYLKLIMELQPYNLYLRALVPFMMVQLGKDDEAYNFIKFWYKILFLDQPVCSVCIFFEESVFTFQFLNEKIQNFVNKNMIVNFIIN